MYPSFAYLRAFEASCWMSQNIYIYILTDIKIVKSNIEHVYSTDKTTLKLLKYVHVTTYNFPLRIRRNKTRLQNIGYSRCLSVVILFSCFLKSFSGVYATQCTRDLEIRVRAWNLLICSYFTSVYRGKVFISETLINLKWYFWEG